MSSKTIDGVPRELLQDFLDTALAAGHHYFDNQQFDALRGLLEKPVCGACGAAIRPDVMTGTACDCSNPAVPPQGEPVALTAVGVLRNDGDGGLKPEWILEGGTAELWAGALLLVADEDQELCAEDGHCELYRAASELPAPVAVQVSWADVEPWYNENEQMLRDVCKFEGLKGVALEVWRAARLNGVKP